MASPLKTAGTVVIAHQAITHPGTVVGSALDVSTVFQATLFLDHALVEAAANTNPPSWYIQASAQSSGNEEWVTLLELPLSENGTPATEAVGTDVGQGASIIPVLSTAGFVSKDEIYIQDTGTLANSEWGKIQEIVTDTGITVLDGMTTAKDASDVIWGDAERNIVTVNVASIARLRVVYLHEGATGANSHIRATMTTEDSIA